MELFVSNMTCEHCVKKIEAVLKANKIKHKVKLATKIVTIRDIDETKAIEAISSIGYQVSKCA
ncbi:MAG: cation transporter [Acholeplasmatales bacterium]|jgi:copper chaperone CopZ|nr:cation transporter [Acholeplasmatales bacterium]